jgi:hypothetical protein
VVPASFTFEEGGTFWDSQLAAIWKRHAPQSRVDDIVELIEFAGVGILSPLKAFMPFFAKPNIIADARFSLSRVASAQEPVMAEPRALMNDDVEQIRYEDGIVPELQIHGRRVGLFS